MVNGGRLPKQQVKDVGLTGVNSLDGLLTEAAWSGGAISYAFPNEAGDYKYGTSGFLAASTQIADAARFGLDADFRSAANDGFALEGFTRMRVTRGNDAIATIRVSQDDGNGGFADLPSAGAPYRGDVWMGNGMVDFAPAAHGDFRFATILHELGHALGLKHPQDTPAPFPALDASVDAVEFSIMSYKGFVGDSGLGYSIEEFGYPQTFMMLDIAALQHLYGANYTVNSGNTVYRWEPGKGDTWVNGKIAIDTSGDVIFATIWDGGGRHDVYDLSAYSTNLDIDLRPGEASTFDASQLSDLSAFLDPGVHFAAGNIYNALLHKGDLRSLIEDARGGSGNDNFTGNQANNRFIGNGGDDIFAGGAGNDRYVGGQGNDIYVFAVGGMKDTITDFEIGSDTIDLTDFDLADFDAVKLHLTSGKAGAVIDLGSSDRIVIAGIAADALDAGSFSL